MQNFRIAVSSRLLIDVGRGGIEPPTPGSSDLRSTIELPPPEEGLIIRVTLLNHVKAIVNKQEDFILKPTAIRVVVETTSTEPQSVILTVEL